MILLDENIRHDQVIQLRQWRIRCRVMVEELAPSGIQDIDIIPLLRQLKKPTFFTHDRDFFRKSLVHSAYSLVWLDIFDGEGAAYIRAFLNNPSFDAFAKRMGVVARVHRLGIHFWQRNCAALRYRSLAPPE